MLMLCLICILYSIISIASARPEPKLIKRQNIPEADAPPNPGYEPPRYAPLGDSSLTSSTYNVNSFTSAANFGNPMQEGLTTTLLPKKWFSFENYQPSKNKNFTESKPSESKPDTEYHFDEAADRDENLLNTAQIEGLLDVVKRRNNKRPMLFEPVFSTSTAKSLLPANGEHFLDSMRYSMSVPAETVTSFDEMTNAGDFAHSIGRKSVKQPIKRATIASLGSVAERLDKSNKGPRYVGDVNDAYLEYSEVEENGAKSEAPRDIFDVTKPPLNENINMSRKQEGDQNANSQMAQLILSPSTAATYEANAEYLTSLAAILTRRHRGSKNVEGNKAFFGLNNPEFKGIVAETTSDVSPSTKKPSILNFIHKFIEIRQETTDTLYPVAVAENATETSLPRMKRGHFRKHNNSLKPPSKDGKETGCATLCVQPKKKGKRKFNKKSKRRSLFKKFDFHRKRNKEKKKQRRQAYDYTNMDMSMLPSNYLMQTNQPGNNQWQYNMPNANDLKAQIPNITESRELNSPAFNLDDKAVKSFDSASPGLQQTAQPTLKFGMPDASQLNPELTNYNPAEPSQNMDQSNPLSTDMDQSNPLLPNKEQQNQYPQFDQSGPNQSPNFDQPNQNPSPSEQLSQNQFDQPNQNPSPNFGMPEAEQPNQNQSPHYDRTNPNQMPRYENPNQLPHFDQPVQNESPFFGKHKQQSHVNQPKLNMPHIDIPQSNEVLPQNAEPPHFNKHKMKGKANSNKKTAKMSSTTIKGNKAVYTLKSHRPSTTLRSWFFEHGINMYKVEPGSKEHSYDESLPVSTANPKTKKQVTQIDNPRYTFPKMNPYNKLFANPQAEQKPMNFRDLDGMNNDLRHDISKLMKVVTDFHDYSNVQDPGKRIGARSQVDFVTEKADRTIKPRHGNMQKYKHAKDIYRPTHKAIVKLSENSRFQSGKNKEKSNLYYNNNNANFAHVTPNAFIDRKLVSVTTPRFNDDFFKSRHESAQRENSNYRYNNILNAEKEAEKPAAKAAEKPADKPPEAKPKSKPSKVKISNHVYKFDIIYSKLHERPGGNNNNGPGDYYDSGTETVDFAPNNMERPSHRNDQSGRQRRRSRRKRFMKNDVFKKLWPKKHDRVFEVAEATATVASRVSGHRPGTTLLTPVAFSAYSKGFSDSPSTTIFLKSKLTEHVKTPEEALEEAPVTMTKPEATNKFTEHFSSATKTLNDKIDNSNTNNFKQPNNVTQKTYNDSIANEEFNTDSQTIDNIEKVLLQKSSNLKNDLKFSFLQKDMTDFHDMFKLIEKKSQKNIIKRNAEAKQTAPGLTSKSDNYNHSTTEQNQMSSEIETTTVNNDNILNKNLSSVMTVSTEVENVTSKTPNGKRSTVTIISTENETVPLDVVNNLSPANLADNNSDDLSFPEPYILLKVPKDAVTSTQAVDAKSEKRGIYIPIDQLMQITESTTPMSPSQPKPNPNIIDGLYMISQKNGKFILRPLLDLSGSLNVKTLTTSLTNQRALPEKIVMSSEFLASIQNKLSRIYDTLSSNQGPAQWASFRHSKDGRRGKRTLNKFPQLCKSSGCLKCRANHTMCKACAATDAVISELIFEFNNLAYFIKNHCNELQLFFAMNPTGGKKLKESVHRVDQLIVRFYKRAKTEESKDCNKFPPGIDKRSVSNVARILDKCTKKTDPYYPRVKLETIGTRNGTNKKVVKNVYSMDNIKVNIICDPVPVTQAHYDYDLATLDILIHSHDMEKLVHKKKKSRFHKLMQKIFHKSDRREIQARANSTSRAVSKRSLDYQMVNNVEPNIITDTGGDFWVQYLKKPGFESSSNEDLDFSRQQRSPTQGYTQAMQTDDYIETNEITLKEEDYATVKPFVSADFPMDETEILTKDLDETELHKPQKNTSKKHKIKNKIFFDEYLALNPHLKNFKEQNDMWQAFPVNSESFVVQDQSTAKPNDTKPEEPEKDLVVTKTVTSNTRDFNATTAQALQHKINLLLDKIHSVTTDLLNQSINFEDIYRVAENQTTNEKYKSSPSVVIVDDDKARKDHYRTKYDGQENTIESSKMSNVIESKPVYYNIVTRKMQKPATFTKAHTLSARHEHKTHTKTTKRIMSQSNEQRTHESQMVIMKRVHNMLVDRKSTSYVQSTSKPPPKNNKQSKWYIGSF